MHYLTATEMLELLRTRQISAAELLEAHLRRIEEVNPEVNAIVTLTAERARREAREADLDLARGRWRGPLHGLPVAHKDLADTAGIRTTYGSPLFADHVPGTDAPIVRRMREAGAITVGKTNTPEFGTGSHTVNEIFGATRNPYDLTRSAGAAAAGPPPRWRPAWWRWPTAPTWAARCATPPPSATWRGCGPPPGGCRRPPPSRPGSPSACRGRWPVPPGTWRC